MRLGKFIQGLPDLILMGSQASQNTIDEAGAAVGTVGLGKFHGFVDGNLDGSVIPHDNLKDGQAQDVAVDDGELTHGPRRRMLRDQGFEFIIVTNQSAVARGLMAPQALADIHCNLTQAVHRSGGEVSGSGASTPSTRG